MLKKTEKVKLIIYQKPTCSTCRQVYGTLKESGVDFDTVNYYVDPIPKKKLKELLKKMKLHAKQLFRTKEPLYKAMEIEEKNYSEDELIEILSLHPELLQRPIIEKGNTAILARPAERIKEIL
ncbi:MAG: arsenate reductase [Ignavibacteria bacterium]|nr:arsenate reductase [Ignavibacteria bacterium]